MKRALGVMAAALVAAGMGAFLAVRPGAGAEPRAAGGSRDYDPLLTRPGEEGDAGDVLYRRYCSGCHGVDGDGRGPAAPLLSPKPRDFTMGLYKFVSTPAGSPPLEEDLLRTITHGLHGTSMPSWRLLSLGERRSLARRVRSFHRDPDPDAVVPAITFHENPFDLRDAGALEGAISRGRELYHKDASCWSCHVAYMEKEELERLTGGPARADLHSAVPKPDVWAEVIVPPDFRTDVLKSVEGLDDIYRVIAAGVGGTAMPTWKDALNAEALWALTIYVDSLRPDSVVRRTLAGLKEARGR